MSDLDPLFPRHGNSGPAPEVTPHRRECAHHFDDRIGGPCLACGLRSGLRDHDETPFPARRLTTAECEAIAAFLVSEEWGKR